MMKRIPFEVVLGGVLVAIGLLTLLLNLGLFGDVAEVVWAMLFGTGGVALLSMALQEHTRWWALIPGAALTSLGLLIAVSVLTPSFADAWGGTIVLGGIGLGFVAIYLLQPGHWWAIIPSGTLLTLAVIARVSDRLEGNLAGVVLFTGLALTFGLVAIAPPEAPRRWALFPAGGLFALAMLILTDNNLIISVIGPVLLILGGGALLYRALRHPERRDYEDATVSQSH